MAQIREVFTLEDRFTAVFTKFIGLAERAADVTDVAEDATKSFSTTQKMAAASTQSAEDSLRNYQSVANSLDRQLIRLNAQFDAQIQEQERLIQAGKQNTEEFTKFDQKTEQLGAKIRALTAQYGAVSNRMTQMENAAAQSAQAQEKHASALQRAASRAKELLKSVLGLDKAKASYEGVTRQLNRFALTLFSVSRIINAVKNAMERAPASIATSFTKAGKNIQDVFGGGIVSMLSALQPAIDRFNGFLNTPQGDQFISGVSKGFELLGKVAGGVVNLIVSGIELITENWDTLAPILISAAIAIGAVMIASAVAAMISWIAATWPLLLIVAVIALIIYQVNQMGYTFEDIFGAVGSVAGWLYAFLYNIVADIWNIIAAFVEFFANVFDDPVGAVARLFFDLLDAILGVVETVAGAIDALLGTDMAGAVSGFRGDMQKWVDDTFGENKIQVARMEKIDYNNTMDQWSAAGKSFGKGLDEFSLGEGGLFSSLDGIQSTLGGIAGDTSALKKSVSATEEDIKSLVEVATQRYVNNINLTSQTPIITVHGQNTGNTVADGRRLGNLLADMLYEGAASGSLRSIARVT